MGLSWTGKQDTGSRGWEEGDPSWEEGDPRLVKLYPSVTSSTMFGEHLLRASQHACWALQPRVNKTRLLLCDSVWESWVG